MSPYLRDLLERVVSTFLGGALTVVAANSLDVTDLTVLKGAAVAGGLAVVSLVKGLLASRVGDKTAGF